jgi:hypothetical protein
MGSIVLPLGDVGLYSTIGVGAGGFREGAFSNDSFGWCAWGKFTVFAGESIEERYWDSNYGYYGGWRYRTTDYSVNLLSGGYNVQWYPRFNNALYFFGGLELRVYFGDNPLGTLPGGDFGAGYNFTENIAVETRFTFGGLEASLKWRF